ncbi:MAG: tRNA lysidine(34) synthetase TilS [Gemmatimonadaceae bacterium]
MTQPDRGTRIDDAVRATLGTRPGVLLAVSGGVDSMVLLESARRVLPPVSFCVATFDHGTGEAATRACSLVAERATEVGVDCEVGRASSPLAGEASLRAARWQFLRQLASRRSARVATAHTSNDQLETVVMRVMRGAGARGIAALYARSDVARPLLDVTRDQVLEYAAARGVKWVEDPSNESRMYFRNRVRHELLPALQARRPALGGELLAVSRAAGALREEVESFVAESIQPRVVLGGRGLDVDAELLEGFDAEGLSLLWPAIAARVGLVTDRRGLARLVQYTKMARTGAKMQLSGGWQAVRARDAIEIRRSTSVEITVSELSLSNPTACGDWRFRLADDAADELWTAWLPTDRTLVVRPWRAGDTMSSGRSGNAKKVKRLLSDAGLTGHKRMGWPVVLCGDRIVWIPGVGRSRAASDRSGRSGLPFVCEYVHS